LTISVERSAGGVGGLWDISGLLVLTNRLRIAIDLLVNISLRNKIDALPPRVVNERTLELHGLQERHEEIYGG
jgi:hypothetical protein